MRMTRILLAAITCLVVIAFNAPAQDVASTVEPSKEFFPQPTEREAKLAAALDQHLSISFVNQPLADVAAWFSSKLEAPVILDHRSLEDAGIGNDTPVTEKADGVSARAALKLTLDEMDLTYLEQDGVLLIMTQDSAESQLVTRVYPVADLTPLVARQVSPRCACGGAQGGSAASGAPNAGGTGTGRTGGGMFSVAGEPVPTPPSAEPAANVEATQKPAPQMDPDFDSLIEVITSTVKPQTWDEVGGAGSISEMVAAKSIVVSQTRVVHDEILELLRALRAAKSVSEPASRTDQ